MPRFTQANQAAHMLSSGAAYVDSSVCLSPGPLHHIAGGDGVGGGGGGTASDRNGGQLTWKSKAD